MPFVLELQCNLVALSSIHWVEISAEVIRNGCLGLLLSFEGVSLQYKSQLGKIKEDAQEVMEAAKRREGLEFVDVDVASLKPKL